MNKQCIIIIPIYKEKINFDEYNSIKNTYNMFNNEYDIIFICSNKLNITIYNELFPNIEYVKINDKYFQNKDTYSLLCLSPFFYKLFFDYEYMLIAQTDAYIFKNELSYWCNKKYNMIGTLSDECEHCNFIKKFDNLIYAIDNNLTLGELINYGKHKYNNDYILNIHGGLSLRKINMFYDIALKNKKEHPEYNGSWWEDSYICYIYGDILGIYDIYIKDLLYFGLDEWNCQLSNIKKYIPFGCHNAYGTQVKNTIINNFCI
jgi:hypothetical protein